MELLLSWKALVDTLDLINCKSFGVGKNNLFRRIVFTQPCTNNIKGPSNRSTMKEMMAHLSIESTNTARLLSISSSTVDYTLRTFLSSTETVRIDESKDDLEPGIYCELRHAHSFQVVSKLHNFITSNQQGEMQRTILNKKPTYISEGRSVDGKLTLEFLGEYAAAIMVDLEHSLSLAKFEDLPDRDAKAGFKINRPKPRTDRFIKLRAELPNCLFSSEDWTTQANQLKAIGQPTCYNRHKHPQPKTFEDTAALREHTIVCFDTGNAGTSGTQGNRGRARIQAKGN